jgi:hypothetical protein
MTAIDTRETHWPAVQRPGREPKPEKRPIEGRAEVESLEALQAERRTIYAPREQGGKGYARLTALYGPDGSYQEARKAMLAALTLRALNPEPGDPPSAKKSDDALDAWAHAHPQYTKFIDKAERERIEYIMCRMRVKEIEEQIRSREMEILAYNSEVRLHGWANAGGGA